MMLEEFASRGHVVTVVTLSEEDAVVWKKGVEVREYAPYSIVPANIAEAPESSLQHNLRRSLTIARWLVRLRDGYEKPQPLLSGRFQRKAMQAYGEREWDVLISFSHSFATQDLASRIKRRFGDGVFWIAYEMDPFGLNYVYRNSLEKARRRHEGRTLRYADLVVLSDGIAEENKRRGHLAELEDRILSLPLPGADQTPPSRQRSAEGDLREGGEEDGYGVRLVYAGAFYDGVRSPDPLLRLLSNSGMSFHLDICGKADESLLEGHERLRGCVAFRDYLPFEEAYELCMRADVLIDIQNDIPNQIPSKVFMYMSTGKPIVSLYKKGCEVGIGYLEDYPNAMVIEKSTVDEPGVAKRFRGFCRERRSRVPESELERLLARYSTPALVDELLGVMSPRGFETGCFPRGAEEG